MINLKDKYKLGIVGGGQLARMISLEAYRMGIKPIILSDKSTNCCSDLVSDIYIYESFQDKSIVDFVKTCDAVILENENTNDKILDMLIEHTEVYTNIDATKICSNRIIEKKFLAKNYFPILKYKMCDNLEDLHSFEGPCVIKSSELGYDGKRQMIVQNSKNISEIELSSVSISFPFVVEEYISPISEASVIITSNGEDYKIYQCVDNKHIDGILHETSFPSILSSEMQLKMRNISIDIAKKINLKGILTIEFFIHDNMCYVNEMAPRVHNSGHWTLDFAATSQFEQIIRCALGMPLGETHSIVKNGKMINILGLTNKEVYEMYLNKPNSKVHLYNKFPAIAKRKLGHINICDI